MQIRQLLTASAVVGALSLGAAGVAVASTSSGAGTTPATTATCTTAAARLQIAAELDHVASQRLALLQQALASAKAKGNETRVGKIQDRISKVTARQQKLEARMQKLEQRCGLPAPTP
jgi:TolA-binding protein